METSTSKRHACPHARLSVIFLLLLGIVSGSSASTAQTSTSCLSIHDLSRCAVVTLSTNQKLEGETIEVIDSASVKVLGNELITVTCCCGASFVFKNIESVVFENVLLDSCGSHNTSQPAVQMSNVSTVHLLNVTISNSSFGALQIEDSRSVSLVQLTIQNNFIATSNRIKNINIVSLVNCQSIQFAKKNTFSKNGLQDSALSCDSYDTSLTRTVLHIDNSAVNLTGELIVTSNFGPSGIVYLTNVHTLANDLTALFSKNMVCVNGAFYLGSANTILDGNLTFQDNSAYEYYNRDKMVRSTACIRILQSFVSLTGSLIFERNIGDVAAMYIRGNSMLNVTGTLILLNHRQGYAGIFARSDSNLILNGIGNFLNNSLFNSVIRLQGSRLRTSGTLIFENNSGNTPCVFRVRSSAVLNGTIMFKNNAGVIYLVDSEASIDGLSSFLFNNIHDFGIGGAIAMFRSELMLSGSYWFEGNKINDADGGVVYGHASTIVFAGKGTFIGNSARYGGAIYLRNMPQIRLKGETSLQFVDNTAIKGGALYIFGSLDSFQCNNNNNTEVSTATPPCFLNIDGPINTHSVVFTNNTGKEGGSILHLKVVEDFDIAVQGTNILTALGCDQCSSLFTQDTSKSNSLPLLSSETFRLCFCREGKPDCTAVQKSMKVIRGERFSISIIILTFDVLKADHSHIIRSYFKSLTENATRSLTGAHQSLEEGCNPLNYTLETTSDEETIVISADESCEISNAQLTLTVTFEDCPEGFSLESGKCVCDKYIKEFLESCNINTQTITKQSTYVNTWIKPYYSNGNRSYNGMIYYPYCPVDYCSSTAFKVRPLYSDDQCTNNRTGVVCGNCREGYSVILGSSKCKVCSNWYLFLLVPFSILGVLLVCIIFLTQLTVATGTIHGLILYANIVNAYRSLFFPNDFFVVYTAFISWLNLDFGFETCFYDGLDQLAYTGWQFVFPVYLWLIVAVIVIICHWSVRMTTIFKNVDPVAVLATAILLSYNKLLQNVIAIYSVAHLKYPPNATDVVTTVWYLDSNVPYGEGTHIVLCMVALVLMVLMFMPYTAVLVFAQLLEKSRIISKCLLRLRLKPVIRVYQAPYKSNTRFWTGLCLLLRCVLLSIYAGADDASVGLLATSLLCFVLLCTIVAFRGIYSRHKLDILEVSFIANLGIFSLVTYDLPQYKPIACVSVSVAMATFIGVVVVQILQQLKRFPKCKEFVVKAKTKIRSLKLTRDESFTSEVPVEKSMASVTTQELKMVGDESFELVLREPLLDDTDSIFLNKKTH